MHDCETDLKTSSNPVSVLQKKEKRIINKTSHRKQTCFMSSLHWAKDTSIFIDLDDFKTAQLM